MTDEDDAARRASALERIASNIREYGYHAYHVSGGPLPRFAYTIGLRESMGAELLLGGVTFYTLDEVKEIIESIYEQSRARGKLESPLRVEGLGTFTLRPVHASWVSELMLGATDYYKTRDVAALQVVPEDKHWTLDVPDMSAAWSADSEPAWRWVRERWSYQVLSEATALTNLDALRGGRITEVTRWEEDEWEMFAGGAPDVEPADVRYVPLGTLLAADPSLVPAVDLKLGKGLWRDDTDGPWNAWGSDEQPS